MYREEASVKINIDYFLLQQITKGNGQCVLFCLKPSYLCNGMISCSKAFRTPLAEHTHLPQPYILCRINIDTNLLIYQGCTYRICYCACLMVPWSSHVQCQSSLYWLSYWSRHTGFFFPLISNQKEGKKCNQGDDVAMFSTSKCQIKLQGLEEKQFQNAFTFFQTSYEKLKPLLHHLLLLGEVISICSATCNAHRTLTTDSNQISCNDGWLQTFDTEKSL